MKRCYFFLSFCKVIPNVRGTLTVDLGKDPKFLGIWVLEVWILVLFLVYFVLFNMCFVTDFVHMCPFELACSGTDSMVPSLYVAVRMNRISSVPLDSMLLKILLHIDCGRSVFWRIKN